MAAAMHMDNIISLKQGTSFQMLLQTWDVCMWAICAFYACAYTTNSQKQGAFLKYCS